MSGVLPIQTLKNMYDIGEILSENRIPEKNFQSSTLDLTVSKEMYRLKGVFVPREGESVKSAIETFKLEKISLEDPQILDKSGVYIVRLNESLNLSNDRHAICDNKSSTGRVDLLSRVIVDGVPNFNTIPENYKGDIWTILTPRSFLIELLEEDSLNQIMFMSGNPTVKTDDIDIMHSKYGFIYGKDKQMLASKNIHIDHNYGGISLNIDLDLDIVGYESNNQNEVLRIREMGHPIEKFWNRIPRPDDGKMFLKRGNFYILVTKQKIRVPPEFSVVMNPYHTPVGELRTHYAGMFMPGFGYGNNGEIKGTEAVLEVRANDDDVIVRDNQPICLVKYYRMLERPNVSYSGNYQTQQGVTLSKHFLSDKK